MSSPKMIRRLSRSSPSRSVLFTVSPMRYFPAGNTSSFNFGNSPVTWRNNSFAFGSSFLFRVAEFAPNPLLDFLIELVVIGFA